MFKTRFLFVAAALLSVCVVVSACSPRIATRGDLPDPDRLAEVVPGEVNAEEVADILGTPSAFSAIGGEKWYYISERVETVAFFQPEVVERNVYIVRFDDRGFVTELDKRDKTDSLPIQFVERTTPTAGNEITFFEQIFGNLGRFEGAQ